ncbi:TRAP transporter large permease [Ancylobacter defluvii]|uniref:TRAP transporter large permease protein n=1 Tax=Ancylobacter defluvii TaxID=1282440 RepID=A0A9W6JYK1_9HYPH|nr:TRAP transporter large permease [Ancylobacter defluvii]MBS7588473.1 TRAP transporter large permease [Ancylobacter defluvii]GLK83753.1 C4-dicarboxylate ABC transporter permease [Ancylobacter defluvii]
MAVQVFGLVFFAMLAIGMPIYLVLGAVAFLMYALNGDPLVGVVQKMLDGLNSETLLAVPFFVMAASFMQKGGVAKAMIDLVSLWVGSVRGGLAIVAILACALFSAICGSSVATAMAMGAILVPAMAQRDYPMPFSLGVLAASGTLGILIPPSLAMILFALIAEESVPRLFLAGVVPGLLQAGIFLVYALYYAYRHKLPREPHRSREDAWQVTLHALPALLLPVIVGVGIYGGLVTVTEASVLAAVVALLISLLYYKGIGWREAPVEIGDSVRSAAVITVIIATALAFAHWLTASGVPVAIVRFIVEINLQPWQFLLIINILLVILGMFLEVVAIMLITLPILVPLLGPMGIDPVHFAVVMTINMELALLTAPVGLNLFVLSSVSKTPLSVVTKGVFPLEVLLFLLLMLVTFVPSLSLWLPNLVFSK